MEERRKKNNNNAKRMTLGHENLPANLTEEERRLVELKAIEGEEWAKKKTGKENPEPTVEEIKNIRKIFGEAVTREYKKGENVKSAFIQETAKKFNMPPEKVREITDSQKGNLDGIQKKKEGVFGKFKDAAKILLASSLGVGAAEALPVADVVKEAVVPNAISKASGNVPNPVLEEAKGKMMPETRKSVRIGIFREEGGVGGGVDTAGTLADQLKEQTEALKREMAEDGSESVETSEEREERMGGERDERENEKASQNEEFLQRQIDKKIEEEAQMHSRELERANENERKPMQERLDREVPELKTSSEVIEYLAKLARDDERETVIMSAEMPDGKIVVLSANPTKEKSGGALEVNEDKINDFFQRNKDAGTFYIDHNHPTKVAKLFDKKSVCESCTHIPYPEKYAAPPSATDFKSSSLSRVIEEESKGDLTFKYRVATGNGVWEFSAQKNDAVGFDKMERLMLNIMKDIQRDEVDIKDREVNPEEMSEKKVNELQLKAIRKVGVDKIEKLQKSIEKNMKEYTKRQVLVESSDPSIQAFVNELSEKGLDVTFTPLKNGKLDLSQKIDVKKYPGWGDK